MSLKGFFAASSLAVRPQQSLLPKCGLCKLYETCNNPYMPVTGRGERKILICGEAPGRVEDQENRQFAGDSGEVLRESLQRAGVNMRRDCWLHNSLSCRPPSNSKPTKNQINYCRPNLTAALNKLKPETIILLGTAAVDSLIGSIWKEDPGGITRWAGFQIPNQKLNAWVVPTYHPSYVMRGRDQQNGLVMQLWFDRHIEAAVNLKGRPWDKIPNYKEQVHVLMKSKDAAFAIRNRFLRSDKPVAFDFETTCLKPESDIAEIVCCSMSDGEYTIAYPWMGKAIEATKEFLVSDVEKVASNLKFEHRWCQRLLGIIVKRWKRCTMLGAHWADNRKKITSIKFQAHVHLGVDAWNETIEPYLKSVDGSAMGANRLKDALHSGQLAWADLLQYCALDSLYEILVAYKQRQLGGM